MPEVIVIDEIGTELEAQAARTIAERGVMLVATAHGNELANLVKNPTLSDLVGGIESVTLGDEEARRRRTQKTVLERAAEPTFPLAVEMHSRHRWLVHRDVARTVDLLLRGQLPRPQVRELDGDGRLLLRETPQAAAPHRPDAPASAVRPAHRPGPTRLAPVPLPDPAADRAAQPERASTPASVNDHYPLQLCVAGLTPQLLEQAIRSRRLPIQPIDTVEEADALLAVRQGLSQTPDLRRRAQAAGVPILVIKADTLPQIQRGLERLLQRHDPGAAEPSATPQTGSDGEMVRPPSGDDDALAALEECRLAVEQLVIPKGRPVELLPRSAAVREMQADLVGRYQLACAVFGSGRQQRLRIFPR
jgi:hypothetical protein